MSKNIAQIKEVFSRLCPHIKASEKLARQLRDFRIAFMSKNPEHMAFFGGNLTGVHVVRFTSQDRDKFFSDILMVDEYELEDELHKTDEVEAHRLVSGDAFNQTCMWLIHLFCDSNFSDKAKHAAMMEVALILYYRFLTSILFRFFPYPVDPALGAAVYSQLSNKFLLKQCGTWQATLEFRAEALVGKNSIHYKTFVNYNNDKDIVKMINDTQGRIKDMIKNIYIVFDDTRKKGLRVKTSSQLLEYEGDLILKDKTKGLQAYTQYMHSIVSDRNSFVRQEILDVLEKIMHTSPPKLVEKILQWCSANYSFDKKELVHQLIDKVLVHSFTYLENNRTVYKNGGDLTTLIAKLKGVYASSRSSEPLLLEIRDIAEQIVIKSMVTKNNNLVASLKTTLMLYIVIRAFTMNYFSKVG